MGFWDWHEKLTVKVSEKNLRLAILGKMLAWVAIGSLLTIQLVPWAYYILVVAVILLFNYHLTALILWIKKQRIKHCYNMYGFIGLGLLTLYFGIQTPQLPFKWHVLAIGVALGMPALVEIFKR